MAWNEPGGGNRDPWGNKGSDQGPPDLDEVVKKLQQKFGGLFGGKRGGGSDNGGGPQGGGKGVAALLVLLAVGILVVAGVANSYYIIEPAERGVVQRFGAYEKTVGPGLHFKIPFVDSYTAVNVDQVKKFTHRAQMLTKDENIVDVTVEVQYRIKNPVDYLFQDAYPDRVIRGAMESAMREVVGKDRLDDIMTENRSGIALAVRDNTRELLNLYKTGLKVININIQNAQPPKQVRDAFADAIKAREDKERVQNQAQAYANNVVPRARGAAARLVEDAKADKARVVAEAQGESQRFLDLLKEYDKAPEVTRERLYLETMQKVLSSSRKVLMDNEKGNNITYLPLEQLMRSSKASGANQSTAAPPEQMHSNAYVPQSGNAGRSSDSSGRSYVLPRQRSPRP